MVIRPPQAVRLVQGNRFLPGDERTLWLLEAQVDLSEMIPDNRVIRPAPQDRRLLQPAACFLRPATPEQDPPQAVQVSRVLSLVLHDHRRSGLALLGVQVNRLADESFRLLQVLALIGPK